MFYVRKKRRIFVIILVVVLIMAGGYILGLYIGNRQFADRSDGPRGGTGYQTMQAERTKAGDTDIDIDGKNEKSGVATTKDTLLVFRKYYRGCKETKVEERKVMGHEIGFDREGLKLAHPLWSIGGFSPSRVILNMEVDGYCPEHFLVKDKDGMIAIYTPSESGDEDILFEETDIPTFILPDEIKDEILRGLVVDSTEELEHFMENFES